MRFATISAKQLTPRRWMTRKVICPGTNQFVNCSGECMPMMLAIFYYKDSLCRLDRPEQGWTDAVNDFEVPRITHSSYFPVNPWVI